MCRISVVTICFNNLEELKRTCKSVDEQHNSPHEHWIIDGSNSKDILHWLNTTPQPAYRKWVCEPDKGIADAFNKGIKRSTGEIVQLLNAADIYANNDVLARVSEAFDHDPISQWLTGKIYMSRVGSMVLVGKAFNAQKLYRGMRSISHPTWFVRRSVYNELGDYDGRYKIAMDYDMMCRLKDHKAAFLDLPLVIFDDSGISTQNYLAALKETKQVYHSHFGFSLKMEIWQIRLSVLYWLQKTPLGKFLFLIKRKLGLENL
ncbi:MAG: glycosyltransferase [bacterium]|jgi:glycosyltransferase involved in cell wall biosynthesis|nr:glycosyltransferase [Chitinophagaceae bacterium]